MKARVRVAEIHLSIEMSESSGSTLDAVGVCSNAVVRKNDELKNFDSKEIELQP